MQLTRREAVHLLLSGIAARALGQEGMASRHVQAQARTAPSGRPFTASFVDVAASRGLREIVVYGGIDRKEYILEANGCGCAFLDYDNDGWVDIFVLCGSRLDGPPQGSTNRLYKNNRDGTFTDVTDKAGRRKFVPRFRPRRPPRFVRFQLHPVRSPHGAQTGREEFLLLERTSGQLRSAGPHS